MSRLPVRRFAGWITASQAGSLPRWLAGRLTGWLDDWLAHRFADRLAGWLARWPSNSLTHALAHWFACDRWYALAGSMAGEPGHAGQLTGGWSQGLVDVLDAGVESGARRGGWLE